jgi:hypothetical protein
MGHSLAFTGEDLEAIGRSGSFSSGILPPKLANIDDVIRIRQAIRTELMRILPTPGMIYCAKLQVLI